MRTHDIRMGVLVTDVISCMLNLFSLFFSSRIFTKISIIPDPITSVSVSNDTNCVLVSSLDETIRLMDRENGGLLNS